MQPTRQWIRQNFKTFNSELFDKKLPKCDFEVFKTGKGSKGGTFGWFDYQEKVFIDRKTNKLYVIDGHARIFANSKNFSKLCRPIIKLNGNCDFSEDTWKNILIHEMVHLFNAKDGIEPKRSHGKEFNEVCRMIEEKTNGKIKITRLVETKPRYFLPIRKDFPNHN